MLDKITDWLFFPKHRHEFLHFNFTGIVIKRATIGMRAAWQAELSQVTVCRCGDTKKFTAEVAPVVSLDQVIPSAVMFVKAHRLAQNSADGKVLDEFIEYLSTLDAEKLVASQETQAGEVG